MSSFIARAGLQCGEGEVQNKQKGNKRQRVRTISAKLNMENIQWIRLNNKAISRKRSDQDTWKCTKTSVIHIAYSGITLQMRGLFCYLVFSEYSTN